MFLFQEHPSSDSFYDSDNDAGSDLTTVERPGSGRHTSESHDDDQRDERERHDSAEVDGEDSLDLFKSFSTTLISNTI